MAKINLILSAKADTMNLKEIRIRFRHGIIDQQAKTNIFIQPEYWNSEKQQIIVPNFRLMNNEQKELKQHAKSHSLQTPKKPIKLYVSFFGNRTVSDKYSKVPCRIILQ